MFLEQTVHSDREYVHSLVPVYDFQELLIFVLIFLILSFNFLLYICDILMVLFIKFLNVFMVLLWTLCDSLLLVYVVQLLVLGKHLLAYSGILEHDLIVKPFLEGRNFILTAGRKLWKRYVHQVLVKVSCHLQIILALIPIQVQEHYP